MSDDLKDTPKATFEVIERTEKVRDGGEPGSPEIPDGAAPLLETKGTWGDAGVLSPLMPPEALILTYRLSAEIPKNARARGQNASGYGWVLEPVVDFKDPDLPERAALWMWMDRLASWRREIAAAAEKKDKDAVKTLVDTPPEQPTEAEVEAEIKAWQERSVMEKAILEIKLETFCVEDSLAKLIRKTEINESATSYCGWEIIRDPVGSPVRAKLQEGIGMRASPLGDSVWVPWLRKVSPVSYETVMVETRFRRYVIERSGQRLWFKEFGDPGTVSQKTGNYYKTEEDFEAAKATDQEEDDAKPATELILWSEYSPGAEPYGMPIWHGHGLDVTTAREAREFDWRELSEAKMPRGVFTILDADIESPVVDAFKKFLKEGGNNRNRFAVLQAATTNIIKAAGAGGRAVFDFLDLSPAQKDEATHLKMKADADEGVAGDFGNPGTYIGRTKDLQNRSTAETAQHVAEQQTYRTLRQSWNDAINQKLVLPWGFRFWRFRLNAPKQQRLSEMSELLKVAVEQHIMTPAQAIPVLAELLNIKLPEEAKRWQTVPPKALQAGLLDSLEPEEIEDELMEEEEDGRTPGETESDMNAGESARGLLQSLGILAGEFMDGPAQKLRKRLGLSRGLNGVIPQEDIVALGPDLIPED